jgi:hypothetical protein
LGAIPAAHILLQGFIPPFVLRAVRPLWITAACLLACVAIEELRNAYDRRKALRALAALDDSTPPRP